MVYLLNFLDRQDLSALGRTSKFMRNQVNPALYRSLRFARRDTEEKNYQLCQLLIAEPLLASFVYNIEDFPARLKRHETPQGATAINPFEDEHQDSQDGTSLEVLQTQAINNCINLESLSIYMGGRIWTEFPGTNCIWFNDISAGTILLRKLVFADAPKELANIVDWNNFLLEVFINQKELEYIDLPALRCDLMDDAVEVGSDWVLPRPQCLPKLRVLKSSSGTTLKELLKGTHKITEICARSPTLNELGFNILSVMENSHQISCFEWHTIVLTPLSLQMPLIILGQLRVLRVRALFEVGWDSFFLEFFPDSVGHCRRLEVMDFNGSRCFKAREDDDNTYRLNTTLPVFRTPGPRKSYYENQLHALLVYHARCLSLRRVIFPDSEVYEWDKAEKTWNRLGAEGKIILPLDGNGRAYFL
ncbi:hypothetical protein FRC01_014254 [Tulasnella sp. 417]|nr:hypothetical protein FRC01_014254 [Tulasnella sp. 417]